MSFLSLFLIIVHMDNLLWQFDHKLFFLINNVLTNSLFDIVMPLLRDKLFWLPLYAFIISFLAINFKKEGWFIIALMILTVALSDQTSSSLIKPLIHRLRPCKDPFFAEYVRTIVGCKPGFSFPSSHAANHSAVAVFLGLIFLYRTKWILIIGILWAVSISYAQIYAGVHYPTDILAGWSIGALFGIFTSFIFFKLRKLILSY